MVPDDCDAQMWETERRTMRLYRKHEARGDLQALGESWEKRRRKPGPGQTELQWLAQEVAASIVRLERIIERHRRGGDLL